MRHLKERPTTSCFNSNHSRHCLIDIHLHGSSGRQSSLPPALELGALPLFMLPLKHLQQKCKNHCYHSYYFFYLPHNLLSLYIYCLTHQELFMTEIVIILVLHVMTQNCQKFSNTQCHTLVNTERELKPFGPTWERVDCTVIVFTCVLFFTPPPQTASSLREGDCIFGTGHNILYMFHEKEHMNQSLKHQACGLSFHRGVTTEIFLLLGETQV